MNLAQITFLYPFAFTLFGVYFICFFFCQEKLQEIYFSNTKMLHQATKKQNYLIDILRFIVFSGFVIALANPIKTDEIALNEGKGHEIALIVDASASMLENNKFAITKEILDDFIAKREHDRLSLSFFADFAYVAVPLTYEKKTLTTLLDFVEVGVAGELQTALYEALYLSSNLFVNSQATNKIALLITDGINSAESVSLKTAIKRIKKLGIKVYTIGIGDDGDFHSGVLKEIASKTGGKFYFGKEKKEIESIYNEINLLEKSEIKTKLFTKTTYYFQYPLYVALFFLMIYGVVIGNKLEGKR
jgi:Ca-activated chloride channel family protein